MNENKNNNSKLVVSFSAGETSAYMAQYLQKYWSGELLFIFANTGEEDERTLDFAKKCDEYFNLNLVWVEAKIIHEKNKGTKHTVVDFKTATRKGENGVFEEYIKKYGIPNYQNQTCTRELKERPIKDYIRSVKKWKNSDYMTAIGIRADEIDRISKNMDKNRLYYPLVDAGITKPMINSFWNNMPFRLEVKSYEGNCKTCWKKSFRKLATLSIERPEYFDFCSKMEIKYSDHVPNRDRNKLVLPLRFFRGNKSVGDIFNIPKEPNFKPAEDGRFIFDLETDIDHEYGCVGSCEPFS